MNAIRALIYAGWLTTLPLPAQTVGTCSTFPADNIWNAAVDQLPLDANSTAYVNTIGTSKPVHPDFGSGLYDGEPIGIPFVLVTNQARVPVTFDYASESDPGPYPIPPNAPVEGGSSSTGDRHVLVVDQGNCLLYELYAAYPQSDGSWTAGSGAIFDLKADQLRPATWTSADAAGLPILPGLVRYDEVLAGEIRHAIRFTVPQTRNVFIWPARHEASSLTGAQYPPMGQRFRLRADFDISKYSAANQVILRALKKYGMMLADNGSSWYLSGAPDDRWNNDDLHALTQITGASFEAVDTSSLMVSVNSAQVRTTAPSAPTITAVVNAASFLSGASPGTWISILGTNLSATTRPWTGSDIVNGALPVQLDNVKVTIDGNPAALSYVSPAQLNVQVPDMAADPQAQVQLTTPQGSTTSILAVQPAAPAFFTFNAGGNRYVAAQHAENYSIVGPAGLYSGSTPAQAGEMVILYATGFGPTAPATPAGRVVQQAEPLANQVTVTIGGLQAQAVWAGLSGAGLDQINVMIPAGLPVGDAALTATVSGLHTQASVFITIGK